MHIEAPNTHSELATWSWRAAAYVAVAGLLWLGHNDLARASHATLPICCGITAMLAMAAATNDGDGQRRQRESSAGRNQETRDERLRRIEGELDAIHADYAAVVSKNECDSTGAVYARYSTKFQDSIADQLRTILDDACRRQIWVPREMIFYDAGVSGKTQKRPGKDKLDAALREKRVQVLLLFATNRLYRKAYRTLEFVDRVHRGWGIRCIFVKSGIDTAEPTSCQLLLHVRSMADESVIQSNVAHIQAAHQGLQQRGLVYGTEAYGYSGDEIEGEVTSRGRPRRRIVIDERQATVVRQIFSWFAQGITIREIVRRLNDDPSIDAPPRSTTGRWTWTTVRRMLCNDRYQGVWRYGATEAFYDPERDYVRQRERAQPLQERVFEKLRIIDDEQFLAVQSRLDDQRANAGRQALDGDVSRRPKILNAFLCCSKHDSPLAVYGRYGHKMVCLRCRSERVEDRELYSELDRQLALSMICSEIFSAISADPNLIADVTKAIAREATADQRPSPGQITAARRALQKHENSILFTLKNVGETEQDQRNSAQALRTLRRDRMKAETKLRRLENACKQELRVPKATEVEKLLADTTNLLATVGTEGRPEDLAAVRGIIRLVTGGRIIVSQRGEKARHRGWLQGRFSLNLVGGVATQMAGRQICFEKNAKEVIVDFVRPKPHDSRVDAAWSLYNEGKLCIDIAQELKCGKSTVTKLLKEAAAQHGEDYVDGRRRRGQLTKKQQTPPCHEQIADEVFQLWHETELLATEIGERVGVDRDTVTRAIQHAHNMRGMPKPDGRARRKRLERKSRSKNPPGEAA